MTQIDKLEYNLFRSIITTPEIFEWYDSIEDTTNMFKNNVYTKIINIVRSIKKNDKMPSMMEIEIECRYYFMKHNILTLELTYDLFEYIKENETYQEFNEIESEINLDVEETTITTIKKRGRPKKNLTKPKINKVLTEIKTTDEYISTFIKNENGYMFDSNTWNLLTKSDVDYKIVKNELTKLSYKDFIKTKYWKIISNRKKFFSNFKCNDCGSILSQNELHTHHLTYDNKGDELNHLDDLIVLCVDCHNKRHSKDDEPF